MGFGIIIASVVLIKGQNESEIKMYNEIVYRHNEMKEYTNTMENIIESLDIIIEEVFTKVDYLDKKCMHKEDSSPYIKHNRTDSNFEEEKIASVNELKSKVNDDIKSRVLHYHSIGLKPNEIAKEMGKGVREVEILLKMYKNIYN